MNCAVCKSDMLKRALGQVQVMTLCGNIHVMEENSLAFSHSAMHSTLTCGDRVIANVNLTENSHLTEHGFSHAECYRCN